MMWKDHYFYYTLGALSIKCCGLINQLYIDLKSRKSIQRLKEELYLFILIVYVCFLFRFGGVLLVCF